MRCLTQKHSCSITWSRIVMYVMNARLGLGLGAGEALHVSYRVWWTTCQFDMKQKDATWLPKEKIFVAIHPVGLAMITQKTWKTQTRLQTTTAWGRNMSWQKRWKLIFRLLVNLLKGPWCRGSLEIPFFLRCCDMLTKTYREDEPCYHTNANSVLSFNSWRTRAFVSRMRRIHEARREHGG